MTGKEALVAGVIAAADNEIVGRIRMQKVFYLLDELGFDSGFEYEYRHYGPYSSDLSEAIEDAKVFAGVTENTRHRQSDGVAYSVFKLEGENGGADFNFGSLPEETIRPALAKMNRRSATVLELAATIHWLAMIEEITDWKPELIVRKGPKTNAGRIAEAEELLCELEIPIH